MRRNHLQNLKRNINMGFRVTPEEQALIRRRQAQTGIRNLRAYLLKMAVDGMVVNLDLSEVNECSRLLRTVSNNVNQLAKQANGGGSVPDAELTKVQTGLREVWKQQDKIIRSLSKILEVA